MFAALLDRLKRTALHRDVCRVARRSRMVLSAGMPRSGSTWLFNAARLLLRRSCGGDLASGWVGDWYQLPRRRTLLLKLHDFDPFLARHAHVVLYSYRDVRDALASSRRKFGIEPMPDLARRWIQDDRRWRSTAHFVLRYESMRENPAEALARLAAVLQAGDVCPEEVLAELATLQPAGDSPHPYHPETLLHVGHITDGRHGAWQGWIAPEVVRQIETEFAEWLRANGYPL